MRLDHRHTTNYPEPLLREFATSTLGASRCSTPYLSALRVVLGNMSLADRLAVELEFRIDVDFATKQTMRTILRQLHAAGTIFKKAWVDERGYPHETFFYRGRLSDDHQDKDMYTRLQRAQEEVDFTRRMYDLGILDGECPY